MRKLFLKDLKKELLSTYELDPVAKPTNSPTPIPPIIPKTQ